MYGLEIFGGKVFWWRRYFVGGAEKNLRGVKGEKMLGVGGEGAEFKEEKIRNEILHAHKKNN